MIYESKSVVDIFNPFNIYFMKKLLFTLLLAFSISSMFAQDYNKWTINWDAGLVAPVGDYDNEINEIGINIGMEGTYNFNPIFGLTAGFNYASIVNEYLGEELPNDEYTIWHIGISVGYQNEKFQIAAQPKVGIIIPKDQTFYNGFGNVWLDNQSAPMVGIDGIVRFKLTHRFSLGLKAGYTHANHEAVARAGLDVEAYDFDVPMVDLGARFSLTF